MFNLSYPFIHFFFIGFLYHLVMCRSQVPWLLIYGIVHVVAKGQSHADVKAYVSSNMPQYRTDGSQKFAEDFSEKYFEAYKVAQEVFDKNRVHLKADKLI